MGKKTKRIDFNKIVKDRKLPILILDNRWHELFYETQKTVTMKDLELKLNNLLKKQGKLGNDIKDMKILKNNLLKEIMANMEISSDVASKAKEKKLDKNKQFINELNDKIETSMDELSEIPYKIKEVNEALMAASVDIFYDRLESNKEELQNVADWIAEIREELKRKIIIKQELESKNSMIYSYMHDILAAELMELFDKENNKNQ